MQTQPMEDINAVLGRFQAWAGTRNAVEAKPGIRELSYEEALQSNRYRWKSANAHSPKNTSGGEPGAVPVADSGEDRDAERPHARARAAKAAPAAGKKPKGSFREALIETVRPAQMVAAAQPTQLARQLSISIRLAPAERELIKTRAAEAGISASAYIRQCVLEVEQLRMLAEQKLETIERIEPALIAPPAFAPGFFARLAQRFL